MYKYGKLAPGKRAGRPPEAGISGRRNPHTVYGEARPKRCQQPESMRLPKSSSAVPDADRPPPAAPPSHPEKLRFSPHAGRRYVT